jgi:hypothetical protein
MHTILECAILHSMTSTIQGTKTDTVQWNIATNIQLADETSDRPNSRPSDRCGCIP